MLHLLQHLIMCFMLSGFNSDPHERLLGVMVFKEAEPFVICPLMEVPDVKAAGWPFEVVGHDDTEDAWDIVDESSSETRVIYLLRLLLKNPI